MSSVDSGRKAENVAADFLEHKGCQILCRNWRTRLCEIDIIALRDSTIFFCEVKYRARNDFGSGIEYITSKKLKQMRFAAESWVHAHKWLGGYQLCAIEISGPSYKVTRVEKDL